MAAKTDSSEKRNDEASCCEKSWWPLKRYGRFIPPTTKCDRSSPWKIFEPSDDAGQLVLTIVQSGHLLISLGQELLEGFSLIGAPSFLKVQRKSDILLFRMMVKTSSKETSNELPGVRKSSVSVRELAQDLGPFLRLCLLDHSFPALVEEVEKELTKLAQD